MSPLQTLEMMMQARLDRPLAALSNMQSSRTEEVVLDLVERAYAEGWLLELIAAARESNPGNVQLAEVAATSGSVSQGLNASRRCAT